jgi:uncharacterized protein YjbJ (UPF0337 family)
MNKDHLWENLRGLAGKIQEQVGKLRHSSEQQAKGLRRQVLSRADRHQATCRQSGKQASRS